MKNFFFTITIAILLVAAYPAWSENNENLEEIKAKTIQSLSDYSAAIPKRMKCYDAAGDMKSLKSCQPEEPKLGKEPVVRNEKEFQELKDGLLKYSNRQMAETRERISCIQVAQDSEAIAACKEKIMLFGVDHSGKIIIIDADKINAPKQ
jgi:hypothetical protein